MSSHAASARLKAALSPVLRLRHTHLGKNTAWSAAGLFARMAIQALYFIIIARKLGVQNYGAFVGVVAIANFFSPFTAWGSHSIMIKKVARDRSAFPAYFGVSLATTVVSGFILVAISALLTILVFSRSISIWIPLMICVSDLLLARFVDIAAAAFQAFERLRAVAFLQALATGTRLVAAIVLLLFFRTPASAMTWAVLYAASSAVCGAIALALVRRRLGWGTFSLKLMKGNFREGFYFAVSWAAQGAYNDIDKTLVGRMDSLAAAGFYAAAYRIEDAAYAPVRALLVASYARFFREGARGIRGSLGFGRRLLPWALAYSIVAGVALYLLSPLLPWVFGPGYQETASALRWIALLPFLRAISYLAASVLTGADRQAVRSRFQIGIAVFNFVLNLILIPRFGWVAAAWTSLASDGLCAVCLWGAVALLVSRAPAGPSTEPAAS